MDDLIFSIVGANSPPSVQSSSNSYQDAKKASDGQSFQDELKSQETRYTAQDRSNPRETTSTEPNSYGIRNDSTAMDVKTQTDKNGVNQKADNSKSSSESSSTQSKKVDDAADDDSDQDNSGDQNSDEATDPQAQAAAAAAAAKPQNADDPNITDQEAAKMLDAAMQAVAAATGDGAADTAAMLSGSADGTATGTAAQVDPTVIAGQNAMQVQAALQTETGDAAAVQNKTDVQTAVQTKQETQTQQNNAANAAATVKTTENAETTSTKSGTTSQSSNITAAAGIFENSSNSQTNNVTSTVHAEPARLAEARAQDIIAQVTRSMDAVVKSGQSFMKIQLYPENLGRIDLRLTSSNQGLVVTMVAESSSTGSMLESQLSSLRQSLSEAGIQVAHLGVGGGGSNYQPGQQQSGRWQNPSSSIRGWTEFGSNDDPSDDLQIIRKSMSNNGVDYKV